jgi:drug/metabolite transporter (DMT)-like permease
LLLNLEAVFTMALAVSVYRERLRKLEAIGACLVVAGAVVVTGRPESWHTNVLGAVTIVGACLAWAFDNNLTRELSVRDPLQIVQIKTLTAGVGNVLLATIAGDHAASGIVPAALLLGFVCYGLSIVLDVYALRFIGAAREAAFFAVAPFAGAVAAVPLLQERFTTRDYSAGILMATGILLVVRGRDQMH